MVYADGWRRSCIDFLLDFKLCNKNLFLARYKKKKNLFPRQGKVVYLMISLKVNQRNHMLIQRGGL